MGDSGSPQPQWQPVCKPSQFHSNRYAECIADRHIAFYGYAQSPDTDCCAYADLDQFAHRSDHSSDGYPLAHPYANPDANCLANPHSHLAAISHGYFSPYLDASPDRYALGGFYAHGYPLITGTSASSSTYFLFYPQRLIPMNEGVPGGRHQQEPGYCETAPIIQQAAGFRAHGPLLRHLSQAGRINFLF